MRRPVAGEPIGQLSLLDRAGIGRIKTDQFVLGTDHHEDSDVIRFGGRVRNSATGIVDLRDAKRQSRSTGSSGSMAEGFAFLAAVYDRADLILKAEKG